MHNFRITKLLLFFIFLLTSLEVLRAQSNESRGARMLYTRYESEHAMLGGGAKLKRASHFNQHKIASEASNQEYVELSQKGTFVSWKVKKNARGFNLRFTLPDDNTGNGLKGLLGLYVNGTKIKAINLTSYWAYQYFKTADPDPYQTPKEKTFMRFDEVHFKLPSELKRGDVLTIKKDMSDTLHYGIDFIELEPIPSSLQKPSDYISVTNCGAVADDKRDDLPAFRKCLSRASRLRKNLFIPSGRFMLSDKLPLNVKNIKISGAGIWHTILYFSTNKQSFGGIKARASNVEIANFSMNTANNARYKYDEQNARKPESKYKDYKGFYGTYGNHSYIHDVWVEHFEVGFWIGGYQPPFPVDVTKNLTISDCRVRNNYADGVNFNRGTSNSVVKNCNFRNNGDDAMAIWPNKGGGITQSAVNDIFHNNTVENNWRAGGAGIFGGYGNQIDDCIIKDGIAGSGIRFANDFPGFTYDDIHTPVRIYDNTIIHCGTNRDIWNQERGAIELHGTTGIFNVHFDGNNIYGSQHNAIQMKGQHNATKRAGKHFHNLVFTDTRIDSTGLDVTGNKVLPDTEGAYAVYIDIRSECAIFNELKIYNVKSGKIFNRDKKFNLVIKNKKIHVETLNLNYSSDTTLVEGEYLPLEAIFRPAEATNKEVRWESSDSSVVTVNKFGRVKAIGAGSACLTVHLENGSHKAREKITVEVLQNPRIEDLFQNK